MPEDATLDEFLSGGDAEDGEDGEDAEDVERESATRTDDGAGAAAEGEAVADATAAADATETPVSTHRWHPEGKPCAACGDAVTRLWRDDAGLVCGDCKEW